MRLHAVLLGVAVAGFAGWLAFWPRQEHPDLVRARDALVASDALSVEFDPGGVGGYRFVWLKGRGWVWERTDGSGEPYPDALVYNGQEHLLRIAAGCYVPMYDVRMPVVPGLTVAPRLARHPGVSDEGESYSYTAAASFAVRPDYRHGLADLEITEDLSLLRAQGVVRATTGSQPGYIWRGDYTIARASAAEIDRARAVLDEAVASDYAEVIVRQQLFGNVLWGGVSPPFSVVVAEACPDRPTQLGGAAWGGQAEGLRAIPVPYELTYGNEPVFRNATVMGGPPGSPGDVSVKTTEIIVLRSGPASGIRLQVVSCTSRPWFRC